METIHSKPDPLREFAEKLVIRYKNDWPISEEVIASEFCAFFNTPAVFGSTHVSDLSGKLNIELIDQEIADEIFGLNVCFKRKENHRSL